MSSLGSDITVPGRPEVQEVSAGVYAYVADLETGLREAERAGVVLRGRGHSHL